MTLSSADLHSLLIVALGIIIGYTTNATAGIIAFLSIVVMYTVINWNVKRRKERSELWDKYTKLNGQVSELSSKVPMTPVTTDQPNATYQTMLENVVLALLKERGGEDFNKIQTDDDTYYMPYNLKERIQRQRS